MLVINESSQIKFYIDSYGLFLSPFLFIVLVSQEVEAYNLRSSLYEKKTSLSTGIVYTPSQNVA